jgi:hypothetical protein
VTPAECEAHGGHCWSNPLEGAAPVLVQVCRHCPTARLFTWNDEKKTWLTTETVLETGQ